MNKKVLWITETAVMLALLVALQAVTKPMGQLVTGSFVNAVLAVTVLIAGLYSGITVAIISPVLAYLLGIAPQILTVPAIMVGNVVFVVLLYSIAGKNNKLIPKVVAWLCAAGAKFAAAVTHYQRDNGCVADGEITAKNKTWKKLLGMA